MDPEPSSLGMVLILLLVPPFALIGLVVVALAAVAALVALAGAMLASPYLLVRTLRRRLAERVPQPQPLATQPQPLPAAAVPRRAARAAGGLGTRSAPDRSWAQQDLGQCILFDACFNDTLFPQTGQAVVRLLERLGCEVEFPSRADLLRADALQLGLRARGPRAGAALRARVRGRGGGGHALGVVRRDGAPPQLEAGVAAAARLRAVGVPGRPAGGRGRGGPLPAPRDLPPDLPLAPGARGGGPAAAAAAGRRGHRPGRAAGGGGVLRLRRHLRGEERRRVLRDARRQGAARARHPGRGRVRGRQLVPHAHRRRAVAPADRRAHAAPGRDPGVTELAHQSRGAVREALRDSASCGATCGATAHDQGASAPRWWASCPTGRSCASRGAAVKDGALAALDEHLEQLEASVTRGGGRCTGPAMARRRAIIVA